MDDSLPSILCVDDDVDVLDLLKEYFTEQGFVVLTATNGVEAFLQVKRWQPKAVILDLFMPRLGGIGALVILVDHDMSLVQACCTTTAVLDFGKLIATGATADVLRDENVMRAYLGTEDVEGLSSSEDAR